MLFGDVESTSKSVYSLDSKRVLSKLSVNSAYYFRNTIKQPVGYQFCCKELKESTSNGRKDGLRQLIGHIGIVDTIHR